MAVYTALGMNGDHYRVGALRSPNRSATKAGQGAPVGRAGEAARLDRYLADELGSRSAGMSARVRSAKRRLDLLQHLRRRCAGAVFARVSALGERDRCVACAALRSNADRIGDHRRLRSATIACSSAVERVRAEVTGALPEARFERGA